MIQKYSIKGDFYSFVPYLGIFFPNILLFRAFQEVNSYESMRKYIQLKVLCVTCGFFLIMIR